MRRTYLLIAMCLPLFPLGCGGCSTTPNFWVEARPNQKKILVSFPPLYSFTHAIAGEDAYVLCMLTSQGPHGYQGTSTDLFMAKKADLVISNGLSLDDDFVEKMLRGRNDKDPVPTLNAGETLFETQRKLVLKSNGAWCEEGGVKHKHGDYDPHLWLGLPQAIAMTNIIKDKLGAIDPDKKAGYEERAAKFVAELKKLEEYGKAKFKDKKNKKFVTMHAAFEYFAKGFDLKIEAPIQAKAGEDPDQHRVPMLTALFRKEDGPRVITVEPQYTHALAESLQKSLKADGIHIKIVTLDPMETAEAVGRFNPDPGYYLEKMRKNIDALAEALP